MNHGLNLIDPNRLVIQEFSEENKLKIVKRLRYSLEEDDVQTKKRKTKQVVFFLQRSFNQVQFQDLLRIYGKVNQTQGEIKLEYLLNETITGLYDGYSVFSIFHGIKEFYYQIRDTLRAFPENVDVETPEASEME